MSLFSTYNYVLPLPNSTMFLLWIMLLLMPVC